MNSGDTAWVLASFYVGLVRRKNVLYPLMQCFIILCVVSLQCILRVLSDIRAGYRPWHHWWIRLGWTAGCPGQPNADYAATIPHPVFMIFQCMFAVITPALVIGAFAERIKFS